MELTPPGQLLRLDCRDSTVVQRDRARPIKLLQWNIERGYKLAGIIEELRALDADVLSLQEVDVGCERSGGLDTGVQIARALSLNYVFLSEFDELHSPLRTPATQGGGVHGNAILTKFDISQAAVVPHRTHPVDWNNPSHVLALQEPRRGERAVLRATIETPQGPLVVYNAHLEVFCGLLSRIAQLSDIFRDSRAMADAGFHQQAILADMNTMAHGIARLSPNYCTDAMRWRSIGMDEAVVWEKHVLAVRDPNYDPAQQPRQQHSGVPAARADEQPGSGADGSSMHQAEAGVQASAASAADEQAPTAAGLPAEQHEEQQPVAVNAKLLRWGLSAEVARDVVNPGFDCPFPARTTVTLDNPRYRWMGISWMHGKLDWALLRGLTVAGTAMGNLDFALSDHRWLAADVCLA